MFDNITRKWGLLYFTRKAKEHHTFKPNGKHAHFVEYDRKAEVSSALTGAGTVCAKNVTARVTPKAQKKQS